MLIKETLKELENNFISLRAELKPLKEIEDKARETREQIELKAKELNRLKDMTIKEFTKKSKREIILVYTKSNSSYSGKWTFGVNENGLGYFHGDYKTNLQGVGSYYWFSELWDLFKEKPEAREKLFSYFDNELKDSPEKLELVKRTLGSELIKVNEGLSKKKDNLEVGWYSYFILKIIEGEKQREICIRDGNFIDFDISYINSLVEVSEIKDKILPLVKEILAELEIQLKEISEEAEHYRVILAPYLALKEL